jgi:hypothetical protein
MNYYEIELTDTGVMTVIVQADNLRQAGELALNGQGTQISMPEQETGAIISIQEVKKQGSDWVRVN